MQPERKKSFCKRFLDIFKWYRFLNQITDEELKVISGTDGALYLVFNRYAARFFACITVFNSLIFVPIYMTGSGPLID